MYASSAIGIGCMFWMSLWWFWLNNLKVGISVSYLVFIEVVFGSDKKQHNPRKERLIKNLWIPYTKLHILRCIFFKKMNSENWNNFHNSCFCGTHLTILTITPALIIVFIRENEFGVELEKDWYNFLSLVCLDIYFQNYFSSR